MAGKTLAPKQTRSRQSLERLSKAALDVLEDRGLDGTTIPRIAAKAGLSPGAVYRRFQDKDALLQTVMLRALEENDEGVRTLLAQKLAPQLSLRRFAGQVVKTSLAGHRKYANLMRALFQYVLLNPNAAFRKRVDQLNIRTLQRVSNFMLQYRKEIKHPDPETAVPFGLILVGSTLREIILMDTTSEGWSSVLPQDDARISRELTRAFLRYLGLK